MIKVLIPLLLAFSIQSHAQEFNAKNFTGTKQELRDTFASLWSDFKFWDSSHCYQRAHVIAYQMKQMGIDSNKVFCFRGDQLEDRLNWWYHVAPMVYYQGAPVVMDRGLVKGATHLSDWLEALSHGKTCREIKDMNEYEKYKPTEFCLYIVVSMYYYTPLTLENLNRTSFDVIDLQDMVFSISPSRQRNRYLSEYPLPEVVTKP
jgi:hypothetical protein